VLADLGDWRTTVLVPSTSSDPLAVEALGVRSERGTHWLVANLTEGRRRCSIPSAADRVALRPLEQDGLANAIRDPEGYREQRRQERIVDGAVEIDLSPYSVVRVDPEPS
jgi:hypothetical protein